HLRHGGRGNRRRVHESGGGGLSAQGQFDPIGSGGAARIARGGTAAATAAGGTGPARESIDSLADLRSHFGKGPSGHRGQRGRVSRRLAQSRVARLHSSSAIVTDRRRLAGQTGARGDAVAVRRSDGGLAPEHGRSDQEGASGGFRPGCANYQGAV